MKILNRAILILCLGAVGGCTLFPLSFESAASLDKAGKSDKAIQAYQDYLDHYPDTVLAPQIYYRIGKNYELESDYTNAIKWYEKIGEECKGSEEEVEALLDLGALYHDKLKDGVKAAECNQKAFARYMDNPRLKNAIQSLLDAQFQTATAFFKQKNFKQAQDNTERIFLTYPTAFIQPDTRAKIESLQDRARRADEISKAGAEAIILRQEIEYNKSFEGDFPQEDPKAKFVASPDGSLLAKRTKASNGTYYVEVAKAPAKNKKPSFKPISQTFGAESFSWSCDNQDMVFVHKARGVRKLEKTNVKKLTTHTLFFTPSKGLGNKPVFHPAGNLVAYVYGGELWLINQDGITKTGLKTKEKLDYTADLTWSVDGTMLRCQTRDKHGKTKDTLLVLDVSPAFNP